MRSTSVTPLSRRTLGLAALGVAGTVLAGCSKQAVAPIPTASVPSLIGASPTGSASASGGASASASPSVSGSPKPTRKPPATLTSLDTITVKGPLGAAPFVDAPFPFKVDKTINKVLIAGTGPVVQKDGQVTFEYVGYNAAVGGKPFASSWESGSPLTIPLSNLVPGMVTALTGKKVGDRVLMAITSDDGYKDGNTSVGIEKGDTIMFVVDIQLTTLTEPWGKPVTPTAPPSNLNSLASLPTVTDNGPKKAPTVTIPAGATKPTALVVQTLIEGNGPPVEAAHTITANYVSVDWDTHDVLAQDYTFAPETAKLSALVPAWQTGLVGKKLGSRVLIIAPPSTTYPKGNATPAVPANSTQVYVVDVLFTTASSSE